MQWAVLHRLLVVLTLLAFVGGMTLQLMPPKVAFAASPMPAAGDCSHMTMPPDDGGSGQKAPCQGSDLPECIKQMGCLGTPSLPLRFSASFVGNQRAYCASILVSDGNLRTDKHPARFVRDIS